MVIFIIIFFRLFTIEKISVIDMHMFVLVETLIKNF